MKFGRTYQMTIQGNSQPWIVGMPFQLRFSTSDTGTPTANTAHFVLYNLPEKVRNDIGMDYFQDPTYRKITFMAGYESMLPLSMVFVGNVMWAYSYREGADWLTEIDALDGGWGIENGDIAHSAKFTGNYGQVIRAICQYIPNLSVGLISSSVASQEAPFRGMAISGNPWNELLRLLIPTDAQVFINKEKVYIIGQDEYLPVEGSIYKLTEDSGIIGSPRQQGILTLVNMVFEPRLASGQAVTLESIKSFSGNHKVMITEHQGIISPTEGGSLTTKMTFFRAPGLKEAA